MKYLNLIAGLCLGLLLSNCAENQPSQSFKNPLLADGQDPWVVQDGEMYHYCYSKDGKVMLRSTSDITKLKDAEEKVIWQPEEGKAYSKELWAPELHKLDGRWYVYVAADDGKNENHRMYVLKSQTESVDSPFELQGKITDSTDKWAIDGTVFRHKGQSYFIWSGWEGDVNEAQNLYIAKMDSPTSISSERVLISKPEYDWEKRGSEEGLPTINEGPEILQKDGHVFLTYSASGSWSDFYCLGALELTGDDPMLASSWTKLNHPVFESNENTTSPGHASFVTVNGKDCIVYHAAKSKGAGWDRYVKLQSFEWLNGTPVFGEPLKDSLETNIFTP